jgi:predicted nucleic acid-binding protein
VEAFGDELRVSDVSPETEDEQFRERLDAGEAEALRGALEHHGTLTTDDLAARRLADERDVPVTGSIGILVLGIELGHIGSETADEWLDTWREARIYCAPRRRRRGSSRRVAPSLTKVRG